MKSKDSKFTRYLKYGRMSVQGEKKKHSISIYYDTQEHRFVKFHASAKTSRKMLIYKHDCFRNCSAFGFAGMN